MTPKRGATGATTIALVITTLILAASLGAYYLSTTAALNDQNQSISSLRSTVDSLVSSPATSTVTTTQLSTTTATQLSTVTTTQLSTTTSVQTQTTVSQTNYTITDTTTQTQTSTTTETTGSTTFVQFYGLAYLSDLPGCAVSSGVHSYPDPCFGSSSNAVTFNCAAAAATSQGCTQEVDMAGAPTQNFTVTVWYPYAGNTGVSWQNCKWTEPLPSPPGPESGYAYCISVNSTSFFVTIPAPPSPV